jgi:hypothetical protein
VCYPRVVGNAWAVCAQTLVLLLFFIFRMHAFHGEELSQIDHTRDFNVLLALESSTIRRLSPSPSPLPSPATPTCLAFARERRDLSPITCPGAESLAFGVNYKTKPTPGAPLHSPSSSSLFFPNLAPVADHYPHGTASGAAICVRGLPGRQSDRR